MVQNHSVFLLYRCIISIIFFIIKNKKKMKKSQYLLFGLILTAIYFAGCNSLNTPNQDVGTIEIGLNELYHSKTYDFSIAFDSVLHDSRCPVDANCFWAGNAQGRFNIIAEGRFHHQIILNTTLPMQQDTTLHGINFKLMTLSPEPNSKAPIDYKKYKTKLIITKK